MKLTESKLREIIQEEINSLNEKSKSDIEKIVSDIEGEFSWNSAEVTLHTKKQAESNFFNVFDKSKSFEYFIFYKCQPGSSVVKELKEYLKEIAPNYKVKIVRNDEGWRTEQYHTYYILLK